MPRLQHTSVASQEAPPVGARSDAQLLAACLERDEDAWRELVSRYGRMVLSIPRFYGLSGQDCDDVFQTVFLALLRQLPQLHDRQSIAKWLITLTHRTAVRSRRTARDLPLEGCPILADDEPPPELASRWEREQIVRQALVRLGGPCEQLLRALYLDPARPSYEDVARRLGLARGTIGAARSRCLSKLIALLRSTGFQDLP